MTTPATTDDFEDPQIAALIALCEGAVNANLPTSDAAFPIIRKTYGWPVNRKLASTGELPLLCIYRRRMQTVPRTVKHTEQRGTFVFQYTMGPTPNDRVGKAWHLLPLVWEEIVRVVSAGHDPAVSSDATILKTAGFMDIDETQRTCDFEDPKPDTDIWPGFVGTLVLSHREEIDTSALQDLLSLDAQYRLTALDEPSQPLVEQILTNP